MYNCALVYDEKENVMLWIEPNEGTLSILSVPDDYKDKPLIIVGDVKSRAEVEKILDSKSLIPLDYNDAEKLQLVAEIFYRFIGDSQRD